MRWVNFLRRQATRGAQSMILGATLAGSANIALAQTAPAAVAKLPERNYARSLSFKLPVVMSNEDRVNIREIRLYMKTPATPWKLQEMAPELATTFECKVPQDGEYWYSLVIVDRAGRMTPPDINTLPPQQRIVVDTAPPVIHVEATSGPDNALCLRCRVEDANADPASLKAVCKTDSGDIPLPALPGPPGLFRIQGQEPMRFPVVVTGMDLAKNVGSKEVHVSKLVGATLHTAQMPAMPAKTGSDIALLNTKPEGSKAPMLPPPRVDAQPLLPTPAPVPPTVAKKTELAPETSPFPGLPQHVDLGTPPPLLPVPKLPVPEAPGKPATVSSEPAPKSAIPYQLINTTHATLDYRIDHVGPSGVGKVEIYMTPDDGQTWHRLAEDADKRSPADVNLPGDGLFGIRIVIANGNGFGGRPPARGDAPHCKIEVDTTLPFVQLRSVDVLPTSGQVEIRWNAQDKNLGATPVNIFHRTRNDGPWQVVARDVKNDGVYRWSFPRDSGPQFFFKVEVADQAGNVAQDSTRQPIVIDMTEPRATIVSVTGSSTR